MLYFIGIIVVAALIPFAGWGLFQVYKRNRHKFLLRELEMRIYSVRIPQTHKKEDGGQNIKQEINFSEQLFAGLSSLKQPFGFEVAVHHIGEEIHFYLAAQKNMSDSAIKQIQGIWPEAHVELADEYNPFNSHGANTTAYVMLKERFVLPVKTYQEMESDTFGPIVGAFSKLQEIGEGAVLQIIMRPAGKAHKKSLFKGLELLKKGAPLNDVIKFKVAPSFSEIKSALSQKEEKEKEKIIDETAIKAFEMKASKPLFEVNVRLIASASVKPEAEHILNGLASGFSQFAAPFRNQFKIVIPRNQEKLIYQYSFREFDPSQMMVLNSEEIASFFHLPASASDIPRIKWLKAKEAPPPANMPDSGLSIGESIFRGQKKPVYLLDDDRRRHVYIIGQTGTGKSTLIYNMAVGDIRAGKGVAVMDPNGDLVQSILNAVPPERMDDVIVFDPGDVSRPVGLNMLEFDRSRPEQKTFIVNEMQGIFNRLFSQETMGPMFEQYMRNALLLLMEDADNEPSTLMEVPRVFTDSDYRERRLERIMNPAVVDFWRNEAVKAGGEASLSNMAPYITSKFNNFIANDYVRPIIAQTKSSFNFREIMDNGKILLVNLPKGRIGEINANLLGMIIVGKLQMAAFSRADIMDQNSRRDFYLYIDEFQNFTTDSIATILSEARKYRLNLIIAHQFIAQLVEKIRDAVFGNVGSIVSLRVGVPDAEFLVKQFEPVFNMNDLTNIDNLNAYVKILIKGETSKPFNMQIPIQYVSNPEFAAKFKELNRLKYGMDRQEIETEIYARLRS